MLFFRAVNIRQAKHKDNISLGQNKFAV